MFPLYHNMIVVGSVNMPEQEQQAFAKGCPLTLRGQRAIDASQGRCLAGVPAE
jgi:hypothetical protein